MTGRFNDVRQPVLHGWGRRTVIIAGLNNPVQVGPFPIGSMGTLDRGVTKAPTDRVSIFWAYDLLIAGALAFTFEVFYLLRVTEEQVVQSRITISGAAGGFPGVGLPRDGGGAFTMPTAPDAGLLITVEQTAGAVVGSRNLFAGWAQVPTAAALYGADIAGQQPVPSSVLPPQLRR